MEETKMKKVIAILVMALLLVSMLPLAFADDTNIDINANAGVSTTDSNTATQDSATANTDAKTNRELRQGMRQDMREKAQERRNDMKQMREKFKGQLTDISGVLKTTRQDKQKIKFELKQCKGNQTDICESVRKSIKQDDKKIMQEFAQRLSLLLERTKEKIQASKLVDAKKQVILDKITKDEQTLADLKIKIEALTETSTKEEIKASAMALKDLRTQINLDIRYDHINLIGIKLGNVVEKADHLETRLDNVIAKLKAQGKDVSAIQLKVDEFKKHIDAAKLKKDKARELFDMIKDLNNPGTETKNVIKQAQDLLKESQQELKQAHEVLKEIVKLIKEQNGTKVLEDTKEDAVSANTSLTTQTNSGASA